MAQPRSPMDLPPSVPTTAALPREARAEWQKGLGFGDPMAPPHPISVTDFDNDVDDILNPSAVAHTARTEYENKIGVGYPLSPPDPISKTDFDPAVNDILDNKRDYSFIPEG